VEDDIAVMTPPSAVADDISTRVYALLRAYQEVFALLARRPTMFWWIPHSGRIFKDLRTPRLRTLVPTFTAVHAARSVRALRKELHTVAVRENDPTRYQREIALLDRFEASLPTVATRTFLIVLVLGVLALSYGTARTLGGTHDDLRPLSHLLGAIFTLSRSDVIAAVKSYHWDPKPIYFTALGLSASLWVLLLLPITSFRLKRGLFNVYPVGAGSLKELGGIDLRTGNRGIYELERQLFERLGRRAPREVRFDLGVEATLLCLGILVSIYFAADLKLPDLKHLLTGQDLGARGQGGFRFLLTAALITASLARLRLLRSIRRGRDAQPAAPARAAAPVPRMLPADLPAASWGRRFAAWWLDLLIYFTVWFALAMGAAGIATGVGDTVGIVLVYVTLFALGPVYIAASWRLWGPGYASPGKRILGLRVVSADGSTPSLRRLLVRDFLLKWIVFGPFLYGFIYPVVNYLRPLWNDGKNTSYDDWLHLRVVRLAPAAATEPEEAPAAVPVPAV
jgi:uncharacterized RDD family membrane protein YckC